MIIFFFGCKNQKEIDAGSSKMRQNRCSSVFVVCCLCLFARARANYQSVQISSAVFAVLFVASFVYIKRNEM